MKTRITRLIMLAGIAALVLFAGSTAAWAQTETCYSSTPSYSPDFTSNQGCLTLNNNGDTGYPGFYPVVPPAPPGVNTVLRLTPNATFTAGSAWYNTQQPVAGAFSTTFTFQLSGSSEDSLGNADGIAFVIQNSAAGTGALGPDGCGDGFGDGGCTSASGGIPNSLAVAFKTYNDGDSFDNANSVLINSQGTGANCIGDSCTIAYNNSLSSLGVTLADGNPHTVAITYTPSTLSGCGEGGTGPCPSSLDVILDNIDLFPGGVPFDLTTIGLNSGNAWVGFTAATGGGDDNQDILSWTFTPQSQSGVVMMGTETFFNFEGGVANGGYNYNAELTSGSPVMAQVTVIPVADQATCHAIVNPNFPGAQCFVYDKGSGPTTPSPVMFELTCPGSPGGTCGSSANPFLATLGTDFNFTSALNPFNPNEPLVGWLKGVGPDPLHPCTQYAGNTPPLFHSNQISSFSSTGDPIGSGKGSSGGTGSCWLLSYNTPGEAPTVTVAAPANGGVYQQGQVTNANYTCTTVNNTPNATGPYLTQASCSAIDSPGGSVAQGAQFDTATLGTHTFTATVVDSATNTVSQPVTYTVVGAADVAILKLAAPRVRSGSKLTYGIGVGDFGTANAVNVNVNDTLPPGTSFLSASGTNIACSIVNKKLACTTTPVPCAFAGGTVSCNVGTVMPFSLFLLNGAVIQITVQVTATPGTKLNNTATVSAANADPKPGNNSSTASTTVTDH